MKTLRIFLLFIVVIFVMAATLFVPWNVGNLSSHPRPVQDYAEAVQRIGAMDAERASEMNPECRVQFMTHGKKVERAIVFVHGYTNCPQQFHKLGQQFYDLGYNVLIAPLPHHGLSDRLTDEQSQLTAEELASYADNVVDIAQGLGEQVTMAGISGGGVVTAWAAQNRSDLDLAVVISPGFGFKQIPTPLTAPVMNLFSFLPEAYDWWDPALKAEAGPLYAYPRYSKHALTQILRLGFSVQISARQGSPAAHALLFIINGNEPSVNNELTQKVISDWYQQSANLTTYEFEASLGLPHDLIDPSQPDQQIDIVYPELISLIVH
jgi:carboxylesterase